MKLKLSKATQKHLTSEKLNADEAHRQDEQQTETRWTINTHRNTTQISIPKRNPREKSVIASNSCG